MIPALQELDIQNRRKRERYIKQKPKTGCIYICIFILESGRPSPWTFRLMISFRKMCINSVIRGVRNGELENTFYII